MQHKFHSLEVMLSPVIKDFVQSMAASLE